MIQVEQTPCWTITCDHCGEGDNSEYGGHFHHPSEATAREALAEQDWLEAPGGILLCATCRDEGTVDAIACPTCEAPPNSECADPHGGRASSPCEARPLALAASIASSREQA